MAQREFYGSETEPMEFLTDSQERIATPAGPLMPVAKMLVQAQADLRKGRGDEAGTLIAECLQKLREHLPPELPALPNSTIGG